MFGLCPGQTYIEMLCRNDMMTLIIIGFGDEKLNSVANSLTSVAVLNQVKLRRHAATCFTSTLRVTLRADACLKRGTG